MEGLIRIEVSRNTCILTLQQYWDVAKINENNGNVAIQNVNNLKKRTKELREKWWSYEGMSIKTGTSVDHSQLIFVCITSSRHFDAHSFVTSPFVAQFLCSLF